MVQRRERLKKQLLQNQLKLIELEGEERLLSSAASGSGDLVVADRDDGEGEEELESLGEEEPCSPPSVRQTR